MPWVLRIIFTFLPFVLLAYLYSGWKLYHALSHAFAWPKTQIRWYLVGTAGYLNLYPVLLFGLHLVGLDNLARSAREGNRFWDFFFAYPFWVGIIFLVEILPWLLTVDFLKLPFFPIYRKFRLIWLNWQHYTILTLFLLIATYVVVRVLFDNTHIRVTKKNLTVRDLPDAAAGLKIVHISDIQADPRTDETRIRRYIQKVNELNPDVVFYTGDLVTSGTNYIESGASELGRLSAKYGVYACLGDHDYWANAPAVTTQLNHNGIKTLEDINHFIPIGNDSLFVTFITNVYDRRPNLDRLHALMGQQPRGVLDILVTHQPSEDLVELAAEKGYNLFLAGHTHGGQVVFKPFGIPLTPPRFESTFYRGTFFLDRMFVSINNGLGLTLAPLRFNAPAEITLINVVREAD